MPCEIADSFGTLPLSRQRTHSCDFRTSSQSMASCEAPGGGHSPTGASVITVRPFRPLARPEKRALDEAVERYGKFAHTTATLAIA